MAPAAVHHLRQPSERREVNEHPVTAKIMSSDYDALTALAVIDKTNTAEQVRISLEYYFTLRMRDQELLDRQIAVARQRHEAALAVIATNTDGEAHPDQNPSETKHSTADARRFDKPITLRISTYFLDLMTAFSLVDDVKFADVIRAAIDTYIDHRRADPHLAHQLDAAKQEYERTLSALASHTG